MSSKGKRRREARRRARQRSEEQQAERPPREEGVAEEVGGAEYEEGSGREEETVRSAAGAPHGRAARKRAKRGDVGPWDQVRRLRVPTWLIVTPVLVIGAGVLAFLILSGGSSGTAGNGSSTPTPDPRVAGLTPEVTFDIQAGGASNNAFFNPSTITANAGEVIEIVVTNTGSVIHNLRLAGLDDKYDTADDFKMPPNVVRPGETQQLVVKVDEPGTYRFRCDFHPLVQTGTLVLK